MPFLLLLRTFASGLFSFVLKYWKIVLPVIIALALAWYINHLRSEVASLTTEHQTDIATIQDWSTKFSQLKQTYDQEVAQFKATITDQNKHVEDLAAQADIFKQQSATAKAANAQIKQSYEDRISKLLAEPKPQTCDAAIDFLKDNGRGLGWQ